MREAVRDYWWAVLVVPLSLVLTVILVGGAVRDGGAGRTETVAAAVTSSASPTPTRSVQDIADAQACRTASAPRTVTVSIRSQRMWLCTGTTTTAASPITTGIDTPVDRTPTGTWRIIDRQTDRYLVGPDYRVFVHYWLQFYGDYGFHDSPWQDFPYGDPRYRSSGSRGCVHVPEPMMARLYTWAGLGTTVTIRT
ncbi:L,D-transpeptidase [Williamsia deligens]|uniref:L,D-transpeptidase n=1 Tax=Williamsia deligens TaxID=321325 RepID=A0ABW3G656_9NOCA|nr:L,D-transpeptidase [Williamsia deligens]MCP2195036.1 L,D-transpeptidase catalytic domain [Williamsia deligens]